MRGKNIDISKWIVLITLSQVSGFIILQFDDLNSTLATNLLNAAKNTEVRNEEDYQKTVVNTLLNHLASKNINSRKSQNVKDFMHKKLVKRIVPHGYGIKDFEYDDKFKVLFKPLVRIHKRKPDRDDLSNEEDRYDLIYVLDDKRFEENALAKDDSLLQPFTIEKMDIQFLPSDNDDEYIINRKDKIWEDGSRPNNQFTKLIQNRYKSVSNANQLKDDKNSNDAINVYLDNDKLKQVLETQREHGVRYDQKPSMSNIYDLINNMAKFKVNNKEHLREHDKPHRFGTIGQMLSKQFKPEEYINEFEENVARSYNLKRLPNKYTNYIKYLDILDLLQQIDKKQIKTNENKKEIQPLGWFGPVGVINSKQFIKTDGYNIESNKTSKDQSRYYKTKKDKKGNIKIPGASGQTIQKQIKIFDEDRSIESRSLHDNTRGWFGSVGHINSKHIKNHHWQRETDTARVPFYIIKPKPFIHNAKNDFLGREDIKSNKFTLLKEIAQLKASNLDNERKKRLEEINIIDNLRTHYKSGEEEDEALKEMAKFDYIDENTTTEKPVPKNPTYPFWNEWTYNKQIEIDDCPGKLIQVGRLCIGAFA